MLYMRAIIKEVGKSPEVKEIENELAEFQRLVGGYIEVVHLGDILLICNEEGKLKELPKNFRIGNDVIAGTAVFVGFNNDGDFTSLDDFQLEYIMSKFEF